MSTTNPDGIRLAADLLKAARHVCVLTGAGVSAESGVPTFRDAGGLWQGYRIEEVATPEGFRANPQRVWAFYNARRRDLRTVRPNPGHYALAELERRVPAFTLITQNVDRLHQRAGSRNVVEIHGNLAHVRCTRCEAERNAEGEDLPDLPRCDRCGGLLRPAVVWFNELLPPGALAAADAAIRSCDVMLVAGTSGVVQPAASFSHWAAGHGARVIDVNPDPSAFSRSSTIGLAGRSGEVLPAIVAAMTGGATPTVPA